MGHWWPLVYLGVVGQAFSALLNCWPFSHSVMSDSLWSHGLQHDRLRCPSLSPGVCPNLCTLSQWCHPTVSSSVAPYSSCPQSSPASGSFPVSSRIASQVFFSYPFQGSRQETFSLICHQPNIPQYSTSKDSKEIKPVNPKGNQPWIFKGCWSWSSNTWSPDVNSWPTGKEIDTEKDWGQKEMGVTECEMVGWHHWFSGHEFSVPDYLGDTEGQGSLACCSPWGRKESYTTE